MIDEPEVDSELEQPRIGHVMVVNHNDFPISDRFDGVPYIFEQDKPLSIPIDAANHIFGWYPGVDQEIVRRHVQKRLGWNTPDMVKEGAHNRFFNKIELRPISYRMVPIEVDEDGNPLAPKKKYVNKLAAAADEAGARA